jgi:hypothetical protein
VGEPALPRVHDGFQSFIRQLNGEKIVISGQGQNTV